MHVRCYFHVQESPDSIPATIEMFPLFLKYSSEVIEGNNKMALGEVARWHLDLCVFFLGRHALHFAVHSRAAASFAKLHYHSSNCIIFVCTEDILQLQVALVNFASSVYPARLNYIDHVLGFTSSVFQKQGKPKVMGV